VEKLGFKLGVKDGDRNMDGGESTHKEKQKEVRSQAWTWGLTLPPKNVAYAPPLNKTKPV